MRLTVWRVLVVAVLSTACLSAASKATGDFNPKISENVLMELQRLIIEDQVKNTTHFKYPFTMFKQKGTYSSYIHQNFAGNLEMQVLRKFIKFYDVNAFVTLWISSMQLEISLLDDNVTQFDHGLVDAINAIADYHDKNMPNDSSLFVFWPQTYNTTTKTWTCSPTNLEGIAESDERIVDYVKKILIDIGMESLWDKIAPIIDTFITLTRAFYIPKDYDDTFINMGLGSLLRKYQQINKAPFEVWSAKNQNLNNVLASLKRYAYRPFSKELDNNIIDPRTFYYMREFIYEAQSRNEPLALIPTWVTNVTENSIMFYKGVGMPFNINNVDLTVSANTLYGLTSALLYGIIEKQSFDEDLQMIYENTTSLIVYEITHNFSSRPDLALTYYPSVYNFLWFTARILNLLNSFNELPFPVLNRARTMLSTAMENDVTRYILDEAIQDGRYTTYFDDFLGDGDKSLSGKPVKHGDDRICSTAMATNTLFYTWTVNKSFIANTPNNVKDIITRSCGWLNDNVLSGKYKPMNVFFSGSIKGNDNFPFYFPANIAQYLNGTRLPKDYKLTVDSYNIIVGVSGVISKREYADMLSQKHFDKYTVEDFYGLKDALFPFWSSEPFTYASTLLALTQCKIITF